MDSVTTTTVLSSTDYPQSVLSQLHALYKRGALCDVTLAADDDSCFSVHSLVLMASSSYFRAMSSMHNHYTIKNVSGACLGQLVEFLYTGELQLTPVTASMLYTAACHLQIHNAIDLCQLYLIDNLVEKPAPAPVPAHTVPVTMMSAPVAAPPATTVPMTTTTVTDTPMSSILSQEIAAAAVPLPPASTAVPDLGLQTQQPTGSVVEMKVVKEELHEYHEEEEEEEEHDPLEEEDLTSPLSIVLATKQRAESTSVQETIVQQNVVQTSNTMTELQPVESIFHSESFQQPGTVTGGIQSTVVQPTVFQPAEAHSSNSMALHQNEQYTTIQMVTLNGADGDIQTLLPVPAQIVSEERTFYNNLEAQTFQNTQPDIAETKIKTEPKKRIKKEGVKRKHSQALLQFTGGGGRKRYRCNRCSKRFKEAIDVMYHKHCHYLTDRVPKTACRTRVFMNSVLSQNCFVYDSKLNEHTGKTSALYMCRKCYKKYPMRSLFRKHFLQCHVRKAMCPQCLKCFPVNRLGLHIAIRHKTAHPDPPKSRSKCRLCRQPFLHRLALDQHRHASSVPATSGAWSWHQCEECDDGSKKFESRTLQRLVDHMQARHPDVQYQCQQPGCDFTAPVRKLLQRHIEKTHGGIKVCDMCDKQFRHTSSYNTHMFTKHRVVADGVKEVLTCKESGCDYKCVHVGLMEQHRRKHMAGKQFQCKECGRKLKTEKSLEKHMNKVHLGIRPYICHQCGLSYGEESELKTHIARHADSKPFQCHICSYGTYDKATYKSHMYSKHQITVDDKMKILTCDRCDFNTAVKSRLDDHMRVHLNLRDIQCPHCPKLFLTKKALRGHVIKVHDPKSYQCSQCGYASGSVSKLKEHLRVMHTHRNLKPYKCSYCDFVSATSGNCRKHIMQRHKGSEVRYIKLLDKLPDPEVPDIAHMLQHSELVTTETEEADQLFVVTST